MHTTVCKLMNACDLPMKNAYKKETFPNKSFVNPSSFFSVHFSLQIFFSETIFI